MPAIARTTEDRQRAQAALTRVIEEGRGKAAAGLEALQKEFHMRRDLRIRPSALDIAIEDTEAGLRWNPVIVDGKNRTPLATTGHARGQLLSAAGVPGAFVDTLQTHGLGELLRENVTTLLPKLSPDGLLVREVAGTAKAFLSPAYKCLDNALFFDKFVEEALASKLVPYRGDVSDTRGFLSFLQPVILEIAPGEFVVLGIEFRGSDYGRGAQELNMMILRLRCLNGATGYDLFRKIHIGRRFDASDFGSDSVIQLSKATIEKDVETVRSALSDVMKGVTKHLTAFGETLNEVAAKDVDLPQALVSLKKKGLKAKAIEKVKALYENEALPVEALPPAPGAWRLSNALSLLANGTPDVDEAADLRDAAFEIISPRPVKPAAPAPALTWDDVKPQA